MADLKTPASAGLVSAAAGSASAGRRPRRVKRALAVAGLAFQ